MPCGFSIFFILLSTAVTLQAWMYIALTLEAEFLVFSEYVVMPREIHIILQLNYFFLFHTTGNY